MVQLSRIRNRHGFRRKSGLHSTASAVQHMVGKIDANNRQVGLLATAVYLRVRWRVAMFLLRSAIGK